MEAGKEERKEKRVGGIFNNAKGKYIWPTKGKSLNLRNIFAALSKDKIRHLPSENQPTMAKKEDTANQGASEKLKALQAAMAKIEKDFGKGSIMKLDDEEVEDIEVIPTGSIALNDALGVGGYPKGRIIEIYGPEGSGKTTLAIHAIAEAQRRGGIAAFIDAEHAFDRFYAEKLGVNLSELLISQPDNGEQALEIADQLIRSSAIDIIVIDSVAALTPKAEIEGDMGDNKVGLQARLMSQALRSARPTRRASLSTSCAKRSASPLAIQRRRRAVMP